MELLNDSGVFQIHSPNASVISPTTVKTVTSKYKNN